MLIQSKRLMTPRVTHMRRAKQSYGSVYHRDITCCGVPFNIYWTPDGLGFRQLSVRRIWSHVTCKNCLRTRRKK